MVFISDILLPIVFYSKNENNNSNISNDKNNTTNLKESDEKKVPFFQSLFELSFLIPIYFLCNAYTVIIIYSTTRSTYITGDFLSGKKINDNLSLMKTLKTICEDAFANIYCNLYFYKVINEDKNGDSFNFYGKPKFFEEIIIPDYVLKKGISIYMMIKIILIFVFGISTFFGWKIDFIFKNDLAEYNKNYNDQNVNDEDSNRIFNSFLKEKNIINIFFRKLII